MSAVRPLLDILKAIVPIFAALLLAGSCVAAAQENFAAATERFNAGYSLYSQKKYQDAITELQRSWELAPHSETAYFLGVNYSKLGAFSETEHFVRLALSVEPPLAPQLADGARELIDWATNTRNNYERAAEKATEMSATLSFRPPAAPRVDVPRGRRSEGQRDVTVQNSALCESLVDVRPGANCRDFKVERQGWDKGTIRTCGLYQVRRYKSVLDIPDSEWGRFLANCD